MKPKWRSIFKAVLWLALLLVLVVILKLLGVAMMAMLAIVFAALIIMLGWFSFRAFRRGGPIAGTVFGVLCLFSVLAEVKINQFRAMGNMPHQMPATTVTSATAKEEDWAPILSAVGSVSAVQGAEVSSELGGVVAEVLFQNGGVAKKGDVLVKLAATSEDADLELARSDLMRTRDLTARKVMSKADLDAAESKFKQKGGAVEKKELRAPFDGQLGIRQVNVGQMIKPGDLVVSLQSLDPVYFDFALPQQDLAKLTTGLEVRLYTDALQGKEFTGKLTAINSMVNAITRNVSLQATLENPDHVLRPGMFAKVEVELPEKHKTLVVPGSAISYAPFGDSVYLIVKEKDKKTGKESEIIQQQFVKLGEARGDLVAITEGLKPNDTIVSTGVFKLRTGMPVVINNDLAPKPQLNPKPVDS